MPGSRLTTSKTQPGTLEFRVCLTVTVSPTLNLYGIAHLPAGILPRAYIPVTLRTIKSSGRARLARGGAVQ